MNYFNDIELLHARSLINHHFKADWKDYGHCSFLLATEGEVSYQRGDEPVRILKAPFVFWHHPHHRYRYGSARSSEAWSHYYAAFRGTRATKLIEDGFMSLSNPFYAVELEFGFCHQIFLNILHALNSKSLSKDAEGLLELEKLLLHLHTYRDDSGSITRKEQIILNLVTSLRENPCQPINFKDWAETMGMSYSNFRLLFKRYLGESPQRFLRRLRMNWAQEQVLNQSYSIQEIGQSLGYENPSVFSRTFKDNFGVSAQELRRGVLERK